ncbi:uncharacterized protein MELLADRAFT_89501 [Melampsora larici-populina 98AG31]|uniref:Uncharacterized protein n=1 Tax=Melampsora larici-populina (strain 98AG31 / pathotype 3-4-7) TaxID=747676 RepID=F4RTK7_MELLP|nr:uncharacterized protein MELLADRAFT_89501 [Melampsora larici-populina 98AG31]EGG04273.1 hypothetical protein MELLADRAFT_89501 [Melampsora larici-populina 98AG31]
MSTPLQFHIFLPSYILGYIVDNQTKPRIDSDLFLSKATTSQIVEVILSFYPYFRFTQNAQEDHELLLKIFIEMVAPRLNNITIPLGRKTDYVQAELGYPIHDAQPSIRWINSSADIDAKRIESFNNHCLVNLKNGQYRLAAENLREFVKKYKYLNHNEIDEIIGAQDDINETFHEVGGNLRDAQTSIEIIQLRLLELDLSPTSVQGLEGQLRLAKISFKSLQKTFEVVTQDFGLIQALCDYHKEISSKHRDGQN